MTTTSQGVNVTLTDMTTTSQGMIVINDNRLAGDGCHFSFNCEISLNYAFWIKLPFKKDKGLLIVCYVLISNMKIEVEFFKEKVVPGVLGGCDPAVRLGRL